MSDVKTIFESMEFGPAPESDEIARHWIDAHGGRFGHFIAGEWIGADQEDGERFETLNPATGLALGTLAQGGRSEVDRAVAAAQAAQATWARTHGFERARYMYALARGIQKHARLFSVLETMDNGKPIREARDIDIPLVARHFYHHAGWAQLMEVEFRHQEPVGVVGQIIPWNFPLLMLAWKVAPALAAGNTVVLKPAEFTSLTSLLFAELCQSVGLPEGVFNVVTGDGRTGEALVDHPDVDKLAFTGSTEVGRVIRAATAGTGKHLSLELGGKSPYLIFDDADLDSAVEGVVDAIWFNQGQVCCAGSRILVHEGIADQVVGKLQTRMEKLRVGDPLDKAVDMGAIVAPVQLERIRSMVEEGQAEGATVWQPSWSVPQEGWFYPPTLCTDVHPTATIVQEEIFGPVVTLQTFRTPAEAVELANNTRYGLAASIWTENVNLALDVAPAIKAGTVWVNCTNMFDAASGFGGYRESGFGREGGREGLQEYLRPDWMGGETGRPDAHRRLAEADPAFEGRSPVGSGQSDPDGVSVDRTLKFLVGGKQVRPDGGYALALVHPHGEVVAQLGRGNRKDVRNAVEAARKAAPGWAGRSAHNRAQILFYLAENLSLRSAELTRRLESVGIPKAEASLEMAASIRRLFHYAAQADKWDGAVHRTPFRNVTLAMPEPVGILGLVPPTSHPLLGMVSTLAPAVAMGNAVVILALDSSALLGADLYQLLDTSDVPAGVVNILAGLEGEVLPTLAAHDAVDGIWHFGSHEAGAEVERLSTGNMKRTWVDHAEGRDWLDGTQGQGDEFLRQATQIKNIWVPYGE